MNEPQTGAPHRELIYVADPMCSWCWGFSPVIEAIARQTGTHSVASDGQKPQLSLVMGGLRPLTRHAMSDDDKASIRHHWEEVKKRSGQPFDFGFFDRNDFVYDTEPAARAVCLMRRLKTEATLAYFTRIQRAFYAEAADVTDAELLATLALDVADIERAVFLGRFNDVASAYETADDFSTARQLAVSGYPTVILRLGKDFALLSRGYQPFNALKPPIEDWLAGRFPRCRLTLPLD